MMNRAGEFAGEAVASLHPAMKRRVLFLCSGNYYRSRHAEIYFNWLAARRGCCWTAESRGLALHASNVGPISMHTAARVSELALDVDPYSRFPLAVSEADFSADHIVAVKGSEHRSMVVAQFPQHYGKIEFWEIHDLDCALPLDSLPLLEKQVERLCDHLARLSSATSVDLAT
jgi:protein-tyrosine phosphatase